MSNDVVAEAGTVVQLQDIETRCRLLLQHINDRIDDGYAKCPCCGDNSRQVFAGGKWRVSHYRMCAFAALLEEMS